MRNDDGSLANKLAFAQVMEQVISFHTEHTWSICLETLSTRCKFIQW